jgi:hypothetical protein
MKLLISIAANVYNHQDIHDYIKRLHTGQANIDSWLNKTVRIYLLNENKYHVTVSKPPKNAPEWALQAKDLVEFKATPKLTQDLEHAIGWLRTFPDTKVFNVRVEDAITQGNLHIERENAKADSKEGTIEVLHTFKDDWTIVSLKDAQALKREGKIMQHCVGNEQQDYIRSVANKTLQIWSLRDPNNQPHCTIEYAAKEKKIEQIKGKQNKGVVAKYTQYVSTWLHLAEKRKLVKSFDIDELINIGVLVQDGTWYDVYNLPKGFTVTANLDLSELSGVTLPENLIVQGSLLLHKFSGVLPEGLVCNSLTIQESSEVKFPSSLQVNVLVIEQCKRINLSEVEIKERLTLNFVEDLILPKKPLTLKSLYVNRCNCYIPDHWTILESLSIYTNHLLQSFNTSLAKSASLEISDCDNLKSLPDDLDIDYLNLLALPSLVKLPARLNLRALDVQDCPALTSIHNNVTVSWLEVSECAALSSIDCALNVLAISIEDCPNLKLIGDVTDTTSTTSRSKVKPKFRPAKVTFTFKNLPSLESLGNISTISNIALIRLGTLRKLGKLKAGAGVNVNKCAALQSLSINSPNVFIAQCEELAKVTFSAKKMTSVDIKTCPSLKTINTLKECIVDKLSVDTTLPQLTPNIKVKHLVTGN